MQKRMIEANEIHLSVKEDATGQDMVLIHGKGYSKEKYRNQGG